MSSTEVYMLLTRTRGWPVERYRTWLAESLKHLLLQAPPTAAMEGPPRTSVGTAATHPGRMSS
ncbi:MAG: hypothetical protein KF809_04810 [Chloroflexi bacterium]|nr:hypothetical protein [Chloroflexota bacterium]